MRAFVRVSLVALLLFALPAPLPAQAETVDLVLALVADVSRSIDEREFELQKKGYLTAFTDPRVVAAIRGGPIGAIAVCYIEFASAHEVKTVLDWVVVRDEASARAFAEAIYAAPRSYWGRTAIGTAIDHAVKTIAGAGHDAPRRVIDVSGDGTNNAGRDITIARDDAVEAGITVNGLVILNESAAPWQRDHVNPPGGLRKYYQDHVAGGSGNFVLEAKDFASFGEAMTRKLIFEIAALPSPVKASRVHVIIPSRIMAISGHNPG